MTISANMKQLFIDTYRLYEAERNYNYLNYGKYPYRDRKNSVQIVADFNANAYSVNGLFTVESQYTIVYPPEIIETIETVLIQSALIQTMFFQSVIVIENNEESTEISFENAQEIITDYEQYNTIIVREYVERESEEIQIISYAFPFNCVPDSLGKLKISF